MIDPVYYSSENCIKFDVSTFLFGDVVLEVLHFSETENKFKQLFVIQFHSFFITGNSTRFTKDQIDGICKDIRYPSELFVDLIFDEEKSTSISTYEDDVAKWKNIISDFIIKGYKSNNNRNEVHMKNNLTSEEGEKSLQENTETMEYKVEPEEKEDENSTKTNTLNKAQEILNKFSKENKDVKKEDEEDDDDIENYLKDLENKTK